MSLPAPADVPSIPLHLRVADAVPILQIPEQGSFEELRAWLREQLPGQMGAINGRSARLDLGAREIKLFDLRRLLHFLREEFSVEITGLYAAPGAIHRFAERELKLKLFPLAWPEDATAAPPAPVIVPEDQATDEIRDAAPELDEPAVAELVPESDPRLATVALPNDLTPAELPEEAARVPAAREAGKRTMSIHRTVRSGTVVRYDGDLFVFGDVNPGANVVATGNITVLGMLKGMAHAGASGDESAFIFSLHLRPTQLRIGRKIAISPDREAGRAAGAEIATVGGEQIVIEPYSAARNRAGGKVRASS
jgi:septum site-determining protein MinC